MPQRAWAVKDYISRPMAEFPPDRRLFHTPPFFEPIVTVFPLKSKGRFPGCQGALADHNERIDPDFPYRSIDLRRVCRPSTAWTGMFMGLYAETTANPTREAKNGAFRVDIDCGRKDERLTMRPTSRTLPQIHP